MKTQILLITGIVILLGFLSPAQSYAAQAWCDTDWSNRKAITISNTNVDSDLVDFPLLLNITDSNLSSTANSDALDIFFTEETTCDKLKWEKVSYTSGTGALQAWVKVPTVTAAANTILYMYYGNSSAADQTDAQNVWDANYKGVYHLEEASGTRSDSTSNSNDLIDNNTVTSDTGQIGTAASFASANTEFLEVDTAAVTTMPFSMLAWFNVDANDQYETLIMVADLSTTNNYVRLSLRGGDGPPGPLTATARDSDDVKWAESAIDYSASTWHYGAAVFTNSALRAVYLDGANKGTETSSGITSTGLDRTSVGRSGDNSPGDYMDGLIDEVWILDVTVSDAFVKFAYHSQKITAGTITLAVQESSSTGNTLSSPTPPSGGFKVVINNVAEETTSSPEVILTFRRNSDASKIAVSNHPDVLDTNIERIQDFKPWNICLSARQQHLPTPKDCESGIYTVYTRFYTEQLIRSPIVSDTIIYEKPEPQEENGGELQPEPTDSTPPEQPDPRLKKIQEQINLIRILLDKLVEQLNLILFQRLSS